MKREELLKNSKCVLCGNKIGQQRLPIFWTVKLERHIVDMQGVKRHDGLSAFLGSSALGEVFYDGELTKPLTEEPIKVTVCDNCATTKETLVFLLAEKGMKNEERKE